MTQFLDLDAELDLALRLVREAEEPILSRFQRKIEVVTKRDNTPVTEADREAEALIRRRLGELRPEHGVIGEEHGVHLPLARYKWVVDPIDGTKAFIHGVPLFGTLLALLDNGVPVVGVIHMPALGESLWAARGRGAWLNGSVAKVSEVSDLSHALLCDGTALTVSRSPWGKVWMDLRAEASVARGWGDCYGHLLVACGRAEAMLDPIVSIWDVAPMGIILPEAGGRFTSVSGEESIEAGNGLSSNGYLHSLLVSRLAAA
jgi:myo-inositol-1(or 4)-monophosphatase